MMDLICFGASQSFKATRETFMLFAQLLHFRRCPIVSGDRLYLVCRRFRVVIPLDEVAGAVTCAPRELDDHVHSTRTEKRRIEMGFRWCQIRGP